MTRPREVCRLVVVAVTLTMSSAGCSGSSGGRDANPAEEDSVVTTIDQTALPAGLIRLEAYGPDGARLDHDGFTEIQTNGRGYGGFNDTLVDPTTLEVIRMSPLYADESGEVVLDRPAGAVALSLAWPTSLGYSTLLIDLPGPGTYNFNVTAAAAAVSDLGSRSLRDLPDSAWPSQYHDAVAELEGAFGHLGTDPVAAAAAADRALDLAVRAALAPSRGDAGRTDIPKGVTIDRVVDDPEVWRSIADIAGDHQAWARLVFDPGVAAETYRSTVEAAHTAGVKVLGQFLDSSAMAEVSLPEFETRVADYVDAFPDLEAWEVGNEVNGNWLGGDVAAKISFAAGFVKARTTARTMLTLYWQLGEDTDESSMFSWIAANLDTDTVELIDDVAVSMWVEEHPMGMAFDRVFTTLAERFPGKRIMIGELGYGNEDLDLIWWWGDATDPTGAARTAVARSYLALAFDRPWLSGGGFWWYYLDDLYPPNELWRTIAEL